MLVKDDLCTAIYGTTTTVVFSSRYPGESYHSPNAPTTVAADRETASSGPATRYPGLEQEQRKMHLAGDYYRNQANLQQQQQQQQQQLLEKPAEQLAHEHYLGKRDIENMRQQGTK